MTHQLLRTRLTGAAVAVATAGIGLAVAGPATANAAPITKTVTVDAKTAGANGVFFDTGIDLPKGATASVTATGTATYDPSQPLTGPNGFVGNGCGVPQSPCAAAGVDYGALVGKVGTAAATKLGAGPTTVTGPGRLQLAYNDNLNGFSNNSGSFQVSVTYTPPCQGLFCFGS